MIFTEYTRAELEQFIQGIEGTDRETENACIRHWDNIAKPIHGLGLLEDMLVKTGGIQKTDNMDITRRAVIIMCSDNGVVKEQVTQTDSGVTAIVTENFAKGRASINRMAAIAGADVIPVDIGVAADINETGILNRKIAYGTHNIAEGPAMTESEALKAIITGIEIVKECKDLGYKILATGEMGIGNTTTSSAMASVLLGMEPQQLTGRGAGLSNDGVKHKAEVIKKAVDVNAPYSGDAIELLFKLGGFDIAGLTGIFIGGAVYNMPVIIDGLISSVAALTAASICKKTVDYMLPSHMSDEPASRNIMEKLGLCPIIHGKLALGEGTGAVSLFPLLDMAYAVYAENTTFDKIHVKAYEKYEG